jgi:hypothetical protein
MAIGLIILLVVAVLALVAFAAQQSAERRAESGEGAEVPAHSIGLHVPPSEFHVEGGDARVYFDVPLPRNAPDPVLQDLLMHHAIEVVRRKRSAHLPLTGVTTVRAYGVRDGAAVEVGSLTLDEPDILPMVQAPDLAPHAAAAGYDPLAQIAEQELSHAPGLAEAASDDALEPICREVKLTEGIDAGLRAQGIDPCAMTATELTLGLLRIAGYSIVPGEMAGTFLATRGASRTYLMAVDHHADEYPELSEQAVRQFAVSFATTPGVDHGLLITDKYGPYLIYDQERREPRCRFVTRERLQAFVDSIAMG